MRRYTVLFGVVAVSAILGWLWLQQMDGQAKAADQPLQYVAAERREISTSVTASGTVEPRAEVSLTFGNMGRLVKLLVKEGDSVSTGQVLAALDTTELEFQVSQAEAALIAAQAQITRLESMPLPQDVAAAKAAVAMAKANLDDLLDRKNNSSATVKPTSFQIDAARAQVDQAQAALDKVSEGASESDLIATRAQANQVYAQLEQARARLGTALLKAPFDGVVASVDAEIGTFVSQQVPVMKVTDLSVFHVTVDVDQVEIGRIREGQSAAITTEAYRDQPLSGRVAFIAPVASSQPGGVASYQIRIDVDPSSLPLRAGMTANVAVTTESRDNAIVIPNRAIELDRETGKAYVTKEIDGAPARVEIQTGIRNDTLSEVVAGLQEGERVVVHSAMASGSISDLFYMPGQKTKK